jgi:Domain of unknown function (DUF222)/HNH endonuclease
MVQAGLSFLTGCSGGEVLIGLEQSEAQLTAARAAVLSRFCAAHDYEADGQFGPKPWLRAFTRVTPGAAAAAMAWVRRLDAHPLVAAAMARRELTPSWAREICAWTDRLPPGLAQDADAILLAAAAGGADLADLAALAWEMIERSATPDPDPDGFADRALWLDKTLSGAARLTGDLTPACTAALSAVLDALSGKAGPEDTRSLSQRRHDALEEACQRLIAAGMLPGRDGQPLHLYAHLDASHLTGPQPVPPAPATPAAGGSWLEGRWSLARAIAGPGAWCPTGPDAEAAACDATITPVITGHLDLVLLDDLITVALAPPAPAHASPGQPSQPGLAPTPDRPGPPDPPGPRDELVPPALGSPAIQDRLRNLAAQHAIALLSGPTGLAAYLRTQAQPHPLNSPALPLDLGTPTPIIPPHLRRAVTLRDQHCQFPGCTQPPEVCQIHHLQPRAHDGPTDLGNLTLLCRFHHLVAIHRWGWTLTRHSNGTTTAHSPDGRTLRSPPQRAA